MDNVICYIEYDKDPTNGMYWTDTPWKQEAISRTELARDGIELKYTPKNQYILMSMPIEMLESTSLTGELPVRLKEIYSKDAPAYTYSYRTIDIKSESISEEASYRLFFLPNRVTSKTQTLVFEFES